MLQIADAVGITDGALYKHFRSREEILLASHRELAARNWAWIESAQAPIAIDRIREICGSHARALSADVEGFNAPWSQFNSWMPNDAVREQVVKSRGESRDWIRSLIGAGQAEGSIRSDIAIDLILAEIQGFLWWEDISYLRGDDAEMLRNVGASKLARLLDWARGPTSNSPT